jgi:hypothetical protein
MGHKMNRVGERFAWPGFGRINAASGSWEHQARRKLARLLEPSPANPKAPYPACLSGNPRPPAYSFVFFNHKMPLMPLDLRASSQTWRRAAAAMRFCT